MMHGQKNIKLQTTVAVEK